ncbi:MAG: DUF3006 domain-containing protein [Chloroflexi bacterium]|nr:DUF3006 domain-containing protein [Chloroflexota bacterium]
MNVPRRDLPSGAKERQWLQVEFGRGRLVSVAVDNDKTTEARERIQEKLDRLRRGDHLK